MRTFRTSIDIAAPPDRVWSVMSDPLRWNEWTPSITTVEWLDRGSLALDARARVRQPRLPAAVWRVTALEPGRRFTWASVAPGVRTVGDHAVEATPGGSRATLTVTIDGPFAGLLAVLTRGITERYIGYEAAGLKARSENPAYRHSGLP